MQRPPSYVLMFHAAVASLAMPLVGFFGGKVVAELYLNSLGQNNGSVQAAPEVSLALAVLGVVVYLLSIGASFHHLKHYYQRFSASALRSPSWTIALALEANVFFFSAVSVLTGSPFAFWGSIAGAALVFWGNSISMYRGLLETLEGEAQQTERLEETAPAVVTVSAAPPSTLAPAPSAEPVPFLEDLRAYEVELLQLLKEQPQSPESASARLGIKPATARQRLNRLMVTDWLVMEGGVYRLKPHLAPLLQQAASAPELEPVVA